jgi:hypothetical protein
MNWTIINSGPYMDMFAQLFKPQQEADGTYVFRAPLGEEHGLPMIYLEDLGRYVLWALQNPDRSAGLELGIATAHVNFKEFAETFTKVTGKAARYEAVPNDAYLQAAFGGLPQGVETKIGLQPGQPDDGSFQTYAEDFTNWFNLYKASANNTGLLQKDYKLLDEILPSRVKSAEEWMRKVGWEGESRAVLKEYNAK